MQAVRPVLQEGFPPQATGSPVGVSHAQVTGVGFPTEATGSPVGVSRSDGDWHTKQRT